MFRTQGCGSTADTKELFRHEIFTKQELFRISGSFSSLSPLPEPSLATSAASSSPFGSGRNGAEVQDGGAKRSAGSKKDELIEEEFGEKKISTNIISDK